MNLMITGGLGFIGFNFVQYLINDLKIKDLNIIIFDLCTYASKPHLDHKLKYCKDNNIHIVQGDICNENEVDKTIKKYNIDSIINFAAETHVDNSINSPNIFIVTNVLGTMNLLNASNKFNLRFHQISTDEVYGSVNPVNDIVNEEFKYNASSPYSSSKASADLIALSYFKTFGTNVTISRCTNNYGLYQHEEKLIPKVIHNIKNNIHIPVYGNGMQMRNWIHVKDHCDGIWKIFTNGKIGEIYNIGSDTLITNIQLIKEIIHHLDASEKLISFVEDRAAHDFCYHLNCDKIKNELGWKQQIKFKSGLNELLEFEKLIF
jgi:dTDP-glucose 4,6-dehydratase